MSYLQMRELARIRSELRMRLMSRRYDDTAEILARFRELSSGAGGDDTELRHEYERWHQRFSMLGASLT